MDPAAGALWHWEPLALEIFRFAGPTAVAAGAMPASTAWRSAAQSEGLWWYFCQRRWARKQLTDYTARWLLAAAPPATPATSSDACAEPVLEPSQPAHVKDEEAGGDEPADGEDGFSDCDSEDLLRMPSWRARYLFAEKDAQRTALRLTELCRDFGTGRAGVWDIYGYQAHFGDHLQAVFRSDGTYTDTGLFRGRGTRYAIFTSAGESFVRYGSQWEHKFFAQRTEDWGWTLLHPSEARKPAQDTLQEATLRRFLPHFLPSRRRADEEWEAMVGALPPLADNAAFGAGAFRG